MSELAPEYLESNSKTLFEGWRDGSQLKQYIDLPENQNLVLRSQTGQFTTAYNSSSMDAKAPSGLLRYHNSVQTHTQTHRHTIKNKMN